MQSRVLLVSPPLFTVTVPNVGLSLLKSELEAAGAETDIAYLNMPFAVALGLDQYEAIAGSDLPFTGAPESGGWHLSEGAMVGDWIFAADLDPAQVERDEDYVESVLRRRYEVDEASIDVLLRARGLVADFMDDAYVALDWTAYDLIGFSSSPQSMSGLALAKRIKADHPEVPIVFGGFNWTDEMGVELHRCFPFVDYVLSGEADETLPALLRLVTGEDDPGGFATLPGLVYREDGETRVGPPSQPIADLDAVPLPDYADYYAAVDANGIADKLRPMLPIEAARGCWWGQRQHCNFCSHNGATIAFRAKSPDRVIDEISTLVDRWRVGSVFMVDAMISPDFIDTVLPRIQAECGEIDMFWEMRANLTRRQLRQLADAGVKWAQPGIESFSSHILRLMNKGTTALGNVRCLRNYREFGMFPLWDFLHGVPGEEAADYEAMAEMLPALRFLTPPQMFTSILLVRYSPYFDNYEDYGIINVRAAQAYGSIYPFPDDSLFRIAGIFDFDFVDGHDQHTDFGLMRDALLEWMRSPEQGELRAERDPAGRKVLVDTRSDAVAGEFVLDDLQRFVYSACRDICSRTRLQELIVAGGTASETELDEVLDWFLKRRLMVRENDFFITLALEPPSVPDEMDGQAAVGAVVPIA